MKFGQTVHEAAVCEIAEELGLSVAPSDLLFVEKVESRSVHEKDGTTYTDHEWHHLFLYLLSKGPLPECRFSDGEVTDTAWIPLSDYFRRIEARDPELVHHETATPILWRHPEIETFLEKP